MNRACAMAIYHHAIDAAAGSDEGDAWWSAVHAELEAVIAAPDVRSAAGVIAWWHHDWRDVGDTAARAAQRIRRAAAHLYRGSLLPRSAATSGAAGTPG